MARRVFFSFHYERDAWRAAQVRNTWVTKPNREYAGYIDAASWEQVKKRGDEAVKKWIAEQLSGTSVTVVLIGTQTSTRDWVQYEIRESYQRGNGMLAIKIHDIKDSERRMDTPGDNNFGEIYRDSNGNSIYFRQLYPTYDWVLHDGYNNLGEWVETAAKKAGR
jgi:hypothetical protein